MKNKGTTILLSVLIALGLWLYVITVENPNQVSPYYNVKVVFEGESVLTQRGLMITSDPDIRVRVDLKSSRTNLSRMNSDNLVIKADLADIDSAGEHELTYTVTPPGNISPSEVKVVNRQPGTIHLTVAERVQKKIPVVMSFTGKVKEGFIMDPVRTTTDVDTITVEGPKEVVDQIHHAAINIDCSNRTETISEDYRYILQDEQNNAVDAAFIKTSVETVRVEVPIAATKRIPLKVQINAGGGATEENSTITLDPAYIDVSGSDKALDKLDELIVGAINLGDIATATEKTFHITLPEGLTNLSGVSEVKVSVSFPMLTAREFTITNITAVNIPEGMTAEFLTKQLTLMVRGPKEMVQNLNASAITVQVDLEGVENTAAMEPVIMFAEPFSELGVVGKYSVTVTVTEAAADPE